MTEGVVRGVSLLAGRYQVGDLIGRGGMADVHVGTDARLGRRVAIKLLRPALATDPAFRTRFRREAQDAAKMAHPTIVRIFDAGEETVTDESGRETQLPFIIMEFVDGRLLKDMIDDGPFEPAEAMRITEQILTALEYSHRAGLVHRDIKPGNIMVTNSGQVKVMDFGIARAISETSATIAETSSIVGTAQYFSPEQARGEAVDARTDLYSTGIVLFEMLTGQAPFVGANPVAVAYQHVNQQALAPSAINKRVTPALDAVVLRSIAKDRFDRFQSAGEFRREVEAVNAGAVAPKKRPVAPAIPQDFNSTLFGVNPTAVAGSEATVRQLGVNQNDNRVARNQNRPPVAWIWGGITIMAVVIVAVLYWTVNLTPPDLSRNSAVEVPALSGQAWEAGEQVLTEANLTATRVDETSDTIEAGTILRTDPEAGIKVAPDDEVTVFVSAGAKQVTVPSVINLSRSAAREALEEAGLVVGDRTTAHSANVEKNVVMGSTPEGGTKAASGSEVTLIVSDGKVDVPSVVGKSIGDAQTILNGRDLQLTVVTVPDMGCSGNTISRQSTTGETKQRSEIEVSFCAASEDDLDSGDSEGDD